MPDLVITVRLPKGWKSVLWTTVIGGTALTLSIWLWNWRKSRQQLDRTDSEATDKWRDLNTFPRMSRRIGRYTSDSVGSRTSINDRLSSSMARRKTPTIPSILNHDSDEEDTDDISSNMDAGRLGLLTLVGIVEHLESLMSKIGINSSENPLDMSTDSGQLINELRLLLEHAYEVREKYKRKLILQGREYAAATLENDFISDEETCSYFSALEQIDLTELELLISQNVYQPFLCNALMKLDVDEIPYRCLRTQLVGCERDIEYLAKLHCLRQAFDFIFDQPEPTDWVRNIGRLTGLRFLHCLSYATADFEESYERLMVFISTQHRNPKNIIAEELSAKGVKVVNFYDVVIDLMLLEALELLSDPPSSVLAVTRHRWLSDNFKRVALDSAIWTILTAKKKLLKYADGFYAHYYTLVGTITPALTWGFLGPDENALRVCNRFREAINAFLQDAFVCIKPPTSNRSQEVTLPTLSNDETLTNGSIMHDTSGDLEADEAELDRLEYARRDDETNDSNNAYDTDDNCSTVISSSRLAVSEHTRLPKNPGMRYTSVQELAEDVYDLFGRYANQLTRMFQEEAQLANNPLPETWVDNPVQPPLHIY